ncbi:MAG: FAD-dependent oxidoreductase [Nitrososphaerota archaeon]|nr:FAD-dependent oxidoreductase [Aigarchaeota archaeon]MDW8077046.1 FAD-dependent oxidoreductase [Nitrososphaerota archaeon]
MGRYDVIIIGGGVTGLAVAHDLALRGLKPVVFERNDLLSGTSGKYHGLLHSGARYAVNDPEAAYECAVENEIIKKIAGHCVEDTGGYFVLLDEEEYYDEFKRGCKENDIPIKDVDVDEALKEEPNLNPNIKAVIEVQDAVLYAYKFAVSLGLAAKMNGADIRIYNEVVGLLREGRRVLGVKVLDKINNVVYEEKAEVSVVAAGPWSEKIANMAKIQNVKMVLTAGTMAVVPYRLSKRVINKMRAPSDGDIVVPYYNNSIVGTTAYIVEDPDNYTVPPEDVEFLMEEGSAIFPAIKKIGFSRLYSSVRPLISLGEEIDTRKISRRYEIYDHEDLHNVEGFLTAIGGKFTTARAMAEAISDLTCKKLGVRKECKTKDTKLPDPIEALNAGQITIKGFPESFVKRVLEKRGTVDEEFLINALYLIVASSLW